MKASKNWTPHEEETLCKLWKAGLSTREIAVKIGKTKNAVIGKAHRIGLPSKEYVDRIHLIRKFRDKYAKPNSQPMR